MKLDDLTNQELSELRTAVITEQERRENLARIPDQITELKQKYVELGGNVDDLN